MDLFINKIWSAFVSFISNFWIFTQPEHQKERRDNKDYKSQYLISKLSDSENAPIFQMETDNENENENEYKETGGETKHSFQKELYYYNQLFRINKRD
jgi:hypothetical protein